MPKASIKARLAKSFLNFLDEHGDYRTTLEEAAARAAAAEANSLWNKGRGKKKKKGRRGKLNGAEEEEEEGYDELAGSEEEKKPKHPQLPEDPYEQIQFYFHTFTHRTQLQLEEKVDKYQTVTKNWVHDELHHSAHSAALSGGMLATTLLLWVIKIRAKKIGGVARIHGILGKKMLLKDYLHSNILRGRLLLQYSMEGRKSLVKLTEKANKAEQAALASMRPYQRKKYERFCKLEKVWEWAVTFSLILGMVASGVTLGFSLDSLFKEEGIYNNVNGTNTGGSLDGHIYSMDGPTDSDGYPLGMRELAEENYAACLLDAEEKGIDDPTSTCDVNSFFEKAANGKVHGTDAAGTTSELRTQINAFMIDTLRLPPRLANYLTSLQSQTIAYLSSVVTFLLFLFSHYLAAKIHAGTMANDPMKHFVLAATDKSIKADGTVTAKRGETEAQRKRRERMLQQEKLKSQMAQLAMEAKQRVQERRIRMEGLEAVEKEKKEQEKEEQEKSKKQDEEREEIVKMHSRQFMMLKMGVPQGAVITSFAAEGIEEEEAKEIVEQLMAIKVKRAEEAQKKEEEESKKIEEEKKKEEEKERIAAERLKKMKSQKSTVSVSSLKRGSSMGGASIKPSDGAELKKKLGGRKTWASSSVNTVTSPTNASVGGGSVASLSTMSANTITDPSAAKSAMLGQIGAGGGLKKVSPSTDPSAAKSAMLGQIGAGGGLKKASPSTDPSAAKSAMLGQIGGGGGLKKASQSTNPTAAKSAMLGQIGGGGGLKKASLRKNPTKVPSAPAPRPESSTMISGNLPIGAKSDKRWDRESKSWVDADMKAVVKSPVSGGGTPKKSNTTMDEANVKPTSVRKIPSRLKLGSGETEEEKKGEEESTNATPRRAKEARELIVASARLPPRSSPSVTSPLLASRPLSKELAKPDYSAKGNDNDAQSNGSSIATPVLVYMNPDDSIQSSAQPTPQSAAPSTMSMFMSPAAPTSGLDAFRRPSARDIQASIAAVANAPDEIFDDDEGNADGKDVDLAPSWLHSPAFDTALRNSNSSWDRRPSSRDVMARIRAVEEYELGGQQQEAAEDEDGANQQVDEQKEASRGVLSTSLTRNRSLQREDSNPALAIIDEKRTRIDPASSFEFRRKASRNADNTSDDDISALSEPTYTSNDGQRSVPSALFVPQHANDSVQMSPMVVSMASPFSPGRRKTLATKENMERLANMGERGELEFPPPLPDVDETAVSNDLKSTKSEKSSSTPVPKVETEEERKRRERAEKRAKKLEAMATRREEGKEGDDDQSAVSGISKRRDRFRRKKKKEADKLAQLEESSVKSDTKSQKSDMVKVETEEERKRRERAEKRAKKLEAMAARRESGLREQTDDASEVTGITKRHRIRRKKSMLSASMVPTMTPEEQARNDFKLNVYASVMNAEQAQWKKSIYASVMNAETTRVENIEAQKELEKQNAAARRRLENQQKLEKRQKKINARSERFHKIRRDGARVDDDESVVSTTSRMRRRRGRKSIAIKKPQQVPLVEEVTPAPAAVMPEELTAEQKDAEDRKKWCDSVYINALQADQNQWKKSVYGHALNAENSRQKRLDFEAKIAKERAAVEIRKEKERQRELRAKKMERMSKLRRDGLRDDDDSSVVSSASRMRRRRGRKSKGGDKTARMGQLSASLVEEPSSAAAAPL